METRSSNSIVLTVAALIVGLAGGYWIARPRPKKYPPERVVLLRTKQDGGKYKAIPVPDTNTIPGYDPQNSDSIVIWTYKHKHTTIKFKDPIFVDQPSCPPDGSGECTMKLPKNLEYGKKYKYTITGKYNDTDDLLPNDPDIEVFP